MSGTIGLDILIDCLRAELGHQPSELASPASGAARDAAISIAKQNKILSLVYKRLTPPDELGIYFAEVAGTLAANGALLRELSTLTPKYLAANINFMTIKGPLQQQQLYGSAFQRRSADLDLLVHEQDFSLAAKILIAEGYVVTTPSIWWHRTLGEQHFHKATATHVKVDLHYRVDQPGTPRSIVAKILFEDLLEIEVNGVNVPALSARGGLLLCTISIAKALYNREPAAAHLCDLYVGLKAAAPDTVNSFLAMARTAGLGGHAVVALHLMACLFGIDVALPAGTRNLLRGMPHTDLMKMVFTPRHSATRWPKRRQMLWDLCERRPLRYASELGRVVTSEIMRRSFERQSPL